MTKGNKLRYISKGNQFPTFALSGNVHLRFVDEEAIIAAIKGDLQVFLSTDAFKFNAHIGEYDVMGLEGYLKADVYDGKGWKPISLEELFPGRDHYFGKRERPIDTYNLCLPIFKSFGGREVMRTYREHYVLKPEGVAEEE